MGAPWRKPHRASFAHARPATNATNAKKSIVPNNVYTANWSRLRSQGDADVHARHHSRRKCGSPSAPNEPRASIQ